MAEGTLRVGIVGVGNNATVHHVPAFQRLPQVELVTCCAASLPRAQLSAHRLEILKVYADVGIMIWAEHLDAVTICSPNDAPIRTCWTPSMSTRMCYAKNIWR